MNYFWLLYSTLLPLNDIPFCIGESVETGNNVVNFGFGGGNGLPLGSEALLDEGFEAGLGNSKFCDSAAIAWLKAQYNLLFGNP